MPQERGGASPRDCSVQVQHLQTHGVSSDGGLHLLSGPMGAQLRVKLSVYLPAVVFEHALLFANVLHHLGYWSVFCKLPQAAARNIEPQPPSNRHVTVSRKRKGQGKGCGEFCSPPR